MAESSVGTPDTKRGQSPEYKALTKSYSTIVDCIAARSPGDVSDQLILLRVLSEDEKRYLKSSRQDYREKARKIMDIVEEKVKSEPPFLHTFISRMDKVDWMKSCTDELKATLEAEQQSNSTSVSEHITLSDKILTIKHKEVILDKLVEAKAKWYYIGKGIGVKDADLVEIDNRYLPDTVRCLDEVLTSRLQRGELACSILCKTLRGKYVERDDVAKDIEQTIQEPTSTSEHTTVEATNPGPVIPDTQPVPDIYTKISEIEQSVSPKLDRSDLENRTNLIRQKFASVVTSVKMALKRTSVTTMDLTYHLSELESRFSDHIKGKKELFFCEELIKQIQEECESDVFKVFSVLKRYYSWINFGLIESIIDAFLRKDAIVQEQWTEYQSHYKEYCSERVCEIPKPLNGARKLFKQQKSTKVIFKIDYGWNEIRFERLNNIRADIIRLLNLQSPTLYLYTVEQGCVELVFEVPQHVADVIFPPTEDQRQALQEHNITYCGLITKAGSDTTEECRVSSSIYLSHPSFKKDDSEVDEGYYSATNSPKNMLHCCRCTPIDENFTLIYSRFTAINLNMHACMY